MCAFVGVKRGKKVEKVNKDGEECDTLRCCWFGSPGGGGVVGSMLVRESRVKLICLCAPSL